MVVKAATWRAKLSAPQTRSERARTDNEGTRPFYQRALLAVSSRVRERDDLFAPRPECAKGSHPIPCTANRESSSLSFRFARAAIGGSARLPTCPSAPPGFAALA